jgi:transcriptional regulator
MKHIDNSYFLEIDEIIMAKPLDIESIIDDEEAIKKIQDTLLKLKDEEKITIKQFNTIIEEHGFFGQKKKSRKEIAEERNCSLQNVGFLYRKAVDRIKEELSLDINKGE